MICIVKSTHDQVLQHYQHIFALQHYTEQVSDQINIIEGLMKTRANLPQFLDAKLKEQVLNAVTASHTHWLRRVAKFERQKALVELGFLTEDLKAKQELMRIVTSSRKMGYYAPRLEWYYAHIRVSPITRTDTSLILSYNRYYLSNWPITSKSTDFNVQIQVPADIVFIRSMADFFQPTACQGTHPMICRADKNVVAREESSLATPYCVNIVESLCQNR